MLNALFRVLLMVEMLDLLNVTSLRLEETMLKHLLNEALTESFVEGNTIFILAFGFELEIPNLFLFL